MFEERIALQRLARPVLVFSLRVEEVIHRRPIRTRWMLMESLAQIAEMKGDD